MKLTITHILTALLLLTIFTACGLQPQAIKKQSGQTSVKPTESRETVAEQFEQKIDLLLEQGAYADAIRYATDGLRQHQTERLANYLVRAINAGLNQSGLLMQSGNFEKAALLLKAIQNDYPSTPALEQQLSKSLAQVDEDFNLSMQKIMDAGLTAYRAGDFATAIEKWEQILAIDPHHVAAQSSLQTTRIQLSKLKDLNGKK